MTQLSPLARMMSHPTAAVALLVFILSVALAVLAVWLIAVGARKVRFIDRVNNNTRNQGGAAMGGGIAVIVVFTTIMTLAGVSGGNAGWILAAVGCTCALGLADDLRPLSPWAKVAGQFLCAGVYLLPARFSVLALLAAAVFLVLTSNAWNLVDVMDGLLGWIGTLCFIGVAVVLLLLRPAGGNTIWYATIAAGVMAGFLVWNRPPARILLGDAGSLSLGLLFGILVVETVRADARVGVLLVVPGVIPLFEVGFLIIQRSMKGIPFYRVTPDHFALRLQRNGYSISRVLKHVVTIGIVLSGLAVGIAVSGFNWVVLVCVSAILLLGTILAYRFLDNCHVESVERLIQHDIGTSAN